MKNGFSRIACATPKIQVADCTFNATQIVDAVRTAAEKDVEVLVLPELCITGYTAGDLLLQPVLHAGALAGLATILRKTKKYDVLFTVGTPLITGGKLYNCAVVIYHGEILAVVPKTFLPNGDTFSEQRYFSSAPVANGTMKLFEKVIPFGRNFIFQDKSNLNLKIAVEIAEDLWAPNPTSTGHALAGATLILNLSASGEIAGKADYRRTLISSHSARLLCGYAYCDAGNGESTTDSVFAGHNLVFEGGNLLVESKLFDNRMIYSEVDVDMLTASRLKDSSFSVDRSNGYDIISFELPLSEAPLSRKFAKLPFVQNDVEAQYAQCEEVLNIQSHGLDQRLFIADAKTAVIGISGGLDSTWALLVITKAYLDAGKDLKDIIAVTMPCYGTSKRTRENATKLCDALGVSLREIDITKTVESNFFDIGHNKDVHNVTFENTQARVRTLVLMNLANENQGLVVGTGDLSELALGWATFNGDHMSMYNVNASVPKTLMRNMLTVIMEKSPNEDLAAVLKDILDTPISPELLPKTKENVIAQETEKLVGSYVLHDFFLYHTLCNSYSPSKIFQLALVTFDKGEYSREAIIATMKTFYKRFFSQQFKRNCMPDGPKVGPVSLSSRASWHMPSDASPALWISEVDKLS